MPATDLKTAATLAILHLEDDPLDADLFGRVLRDGGLDCRITLVGTRDRYRAALSSSDFDLILSDNTLPDLNGAAALELAKSLRPGVPFIFLSGSIGEEAAIQALKNGATDYILKDRANRLVSAVARAMKERNELEIRRSAEEALRISEERYALAAMGANDGLWDWDLKGGSVYFSTRWKAMLGYGEDEIGTDPEEWFRRIHPEEKDVVRSQIELHLKGKSPKLESEYRMLTKKGSYIWVICRGIAVPDANGKPCRMAGSQGDITNRKKAEEQLLYDAFHDSLTGLFNRNLFLNSLQRLLWMGKRKDNPKFAVVLLGLDRFGSINDGFGRQVGDQILKEAAGRIAAKVRPGDTLARMAGDEFALLMEETDSPANAIRMVKRIQEEFQRAFWVGGKRETFLSVGAGIVHAGVAYRSPDEVLRDSGIALRKAKSQGKSNLAVFGAGMHEQAVALLSMETDLRYAVERNEFTVHYQPILALASGRLAGFEALVRWQHPTRGLVPPMEFIPLAEETNFIDAIGKIVLAEACGQLTAWQRAYPGRQDLTISVNVSGRQFRQPDLVQQITGILAATGLNPGCLKLEITETAIMDDPKAAAKTLLELKQAGISLQIDDFGTGYSSLGYLHKFPTQALKIDQSFVSLIGAQGQDAQISSTIVALAHNLGMQVIAEGIETEEQLRYLKEMNCDFGQGYYFSKPVPADLAEKLIAESARQG